MKQFLVLFVLLSTQAFAALNYGTWNIRNFDYDVRERIHTDKPALEQMITALKPDLLGVNEIVNTTEFETFIASKLPTHQIRLSRCGGDHGQHLGFLYNTSKLRLISFDEELSISNPGGAPTCDSGSRPLVYAQFEEIATGEKFYALQVHLKSGGAPDSYKKRAQQYQIIANFVNHLKSQGNSKIILSGDFNTTGYVLKDSDYKNFVSMVSNAGMVDLSANMPCSAYWWGGTDDGVEDPTLLDHIIATPDFIVNKGASSRATGHCQKVSCRSATADELGVSYQGVSDHCPQTVQAR